MSLWLPVFPILVPLLTAIVAMLMRKSPSGQQAVSLLGSVILLVASIALFAAVWNDGVQVVHLGGWQAPFGITFAVDLLGAVMVLIAAITMTAVAVYAMGSLDAERKKYYFHPLYHLLIMGVCGSFVTGDLFNLYVWFEVLLISSFALLVLGNEKEQIKGAVIYVILNLLGSATFLIAVGMLYGLTGTLNMADLAVKVPLAAAESPGLVTAVAMLLMIAFGAKAAVFPLFFWLPTSYHTPPIAISAIFAGLLTKVGVYTLVRAFTLFFVHDVSTTHTILLWISGITMVTGVLGAASQSDTRKILSYHIISQIGYMIMGLALFTPLAIVGSVFYIVHHIIVKTNLFLVAGVGERLTGSFDLAKTGGLYKDHPWLAVLFFIPAFSLAGFPPLSGFWAKLILIKAGLDVGQYAIVAVALVVGLLTAFSMTKIWAGAFWKPLPEDAVHTPRPVGLALMMSPIAALAIMTMVIGLGAEAFFVFAERAAATLIDPAAYIQAVLGPQP